jgi:hypothetical protein
LKPGESDKDNEELENISDEVATLLKDGGSEEETENERMIYLSVVGLLTRILNVGVESIENRVGRATEGPNEIELQLPPVPTAIRTIELAK